MPFQSFGLNLEDAGVKVFKSLNPVIFPFRKNVKKNPNEAVVQNIVDYR
jgi:hypothetical protein